MNATCSGKGKHRLPLAALIAVTVPLHCCSSPNKRPQRNLEQSPRDDAGNYQDI